MDYVAAIKQDENDDEAILVVPSFKKKRKRRNKKNKNNKGGEQVSKEPLAVNKNKLSSHITLLEESERRKKNRDFSSDDSIDFL